MVIDKDRAFVNAANAEISNVPLVHCWKLWNHIFQAMRLWLRKHGAPSQDIAIYSEDVFKLFHSVSEEQYEQQLAIVSQKWDAAFEHYYRNEIHPDVPSSIGRWVLEELHIYNPYSRVTNNQSEGLNRVIKDLQGWKEAPVDCDACSIPTTGILSQRNQAGACGYRRVPPQIGLCQHSSQSWFGGLHSDQHS